MFSTKFPIIVGWAGWVGCFQAINFQECWKGYFTGVVVAYLLQNILHSIENKLGWAECYTIPQYFIKIKQSGGKHIFVVCITGLSLLKVAQSGKYHCCGVSKSIQIFYNHGLDTPWIIKIYQPTQGNEWLIFSYIYVVTTHKSKCLLLDD